MKTLLLTSLLAVSSVSLLAFQPALYYKLHATASGTGLQTGAPEPTTPASATQPAPGGRLPQSSPPSSPTP